METGYLKHCILVILLMIALSLGLAKSVDVRVTDEAGIKVALPDAVGHWVGSDLRFCWNSACRKDFTMSHNQDPDKCPHCGSEAGPMALGEKEILPADTIILKKQYKHPSGDDVYVSIVLSGNDRTSIHRPQLCLVGQGNEILNSHVITAPIDGRLPLDVMVLDISRDAKSATGHTLRLPRYYAYWFVGKNRETPYHIQRLLWMATDRIFRNVAHRWAYVSISGMREVSSDAHYAKIKQFVHDLYPYMLVEDY